MNKSLAHPRVQPVAIVGIGCRFPGGVADAESFWRLLVDGRDAIAEIPPSRIDLGHYFDEQPATPGRMMTRWGGFIDGIDQFDAEFFGISPREAERIDPQQRLLLETAWEALEDAGQDISQLRGAQAGVFIGQWLSDFEARLFSDPEAVDFYMTTGSGRYASSGRVSYAFGLNGPSLTLDTACSSSLVAVHLAVRSILSGECGLALAGGVNVILQPHISIAYSQSRMMAPDGRCKFGDAGGDGYVRSEGAGIVVLKPLDRALADNDRIYAVIHGSATNNDGCSSGSMGTPSRTGQEELLRAAYADAGQSIGEVGYFEAHGTGTRVGDPIELGAIATVLRESGDAASPAYVGSVKTNIGHTEGAAGIAGLIKAALALRHGTIPPSLHCNQLNPAISWGDFPCTIVRALTPWPAGGRPRLAGVSAFGISGSNAHVVLGEAPAGGSFGTLTAPRRATELLPLSARSASALRHLAAEYGKLLEHNQHALRNVCWSAATRRAPQDHRAVFIASSAAAMVNALRGYSVDEDAAEVVPHVDSKPKIAFVIPGQGGQWTGMARELVQREPAFLAALMECDEAIREIVDWSIVEQISAQTGTDVYRLDQIDVIQPVLVAIAIAYAALWRALGIEPDAVVGHSMGEVGAAYISGILDLASAMRIVCLRSKLLRRTSGQGAMALVDLPIDEATARLVGREDRVSIAASNSPRSVVISGDPDAVNAVITEFERDDIFCRLINVDVASHSPQMEPLVGELVEGLSDLSFSPARVPFYSTVLGSRAKGSEIVASYWGRNLRQPVLFASAVSHLLADGVTIFIELGPHPILLHSVQQTAQSSDCAVVTISTGRRDESEQATVFAGFGALWTSGYPVEWQRLMPERGQSIQLPRHPWNRARHWVEAAEMVSASSDATVRPTALDEETRGWLYRLQWSEAGSEPKSARAHTRCLLALDDADFGAAVKARLEQDGASAVTVTTLEDMEIAVAGFLSHDSKPGDIVVVSSENPDAAYLPVRALQAVLKSGGAGARLRLVTRGAQAVDTERVSPDQAAAWGAGRVIAEEHPDLWAGLIDLDPSATMLDNAALLARQLLDRADEDQVAFRQQKRFFLRLVPDRDRDVRSPAYAWRRDTAYLITGGLGDVGLQIARAMAGAGARRLILMNRSPLPTRETWSGIAQDTAAGRRIAAVRALEASGVAVHVVAVDASDERALRAFCDRYKAEGWPDIRGVIHAAGTLDNHLAADMSREQFDAVVGPKLRSAQLLDRVLPDLDLFVLFSSTGAFLAQAGQANYAAANAGLDALSHDRRARGLPAQSIGWGIWENTGLVKNEAGRSNVVEMARRGINSFAPERGASLFGWLCGRDVPSVAVMPVDWTIFNDSRGGRDLPLYRVMLADQHDRAPSADLLVRLAKADELERKRLIEAVVRHAVGKVLKLASSDLEPRRTLGSMGLNSLMAMELRNRLEAALGRPLSATLAWNYPTVAALVSHLAGANDPNLALPKPQLPISELPDRVIDLADISDEEALAVLRA